MNLAAVLVRAAEILLLLGMGCAGLRMLRGPRARDRVLALDAFSMDGVLLVLVVGLDIGSSLYLEVALILALLGFASTTALARFLLRGGVIE